MTFTVPVKTVNTLNHDRGNSRLAAIIKTNRRKKEREAARLCTMAALGERGLGSLGFWHGKVNATVMLTRLSPGQLDSDGLTAATKSVRDGIADALGVDDGSSLVVWKYEQRKVKRGQFGVEVSIG